MTWLVQGVDLLHIGNLLQLVASLRSSSYCTAVEMKGLAEFGVIDFYQASLLVSEQLKHSAAANRTELDVCYLTSFGEVDFATSVAVK